jgi:hypothetical protein
MATRGPIRILPDGKLPEEFRYMGRTARHQGDFGADVGLADMLHVSADADETINPYAPDPGNRYYHGGVVRHDSGSWWVYLEWGTASYSAQSWSGGEFRAEQERAECGFQFVQCDSEADARDFFKTWLEGKNLQKIEQKKLGGVYIWTPRTTSSRARKRSGYIVQDLASRSRGLPHAYTFLSHTLAKRTITGRSSTSSQVTALALALTRGTQSYTRELFDSAGLVPSLAVIQDVRRTYLPQVISFLERAPSPPRGSSATAAKKQQYTRDLAVFKQTATWRELSELSEYIASLIPRHIPRGATRGERAEILVLDDPQDVVNLQRDLDAFESAIEQGIHLDRSLTDTSPDQLLNAHLEWLSPTSALGRWLHAAVPAMTNNRHGGVGRLKILNAFSVSRPDRDAPFEESLSTIAKRNPAAKTSFRARLQPSHRPDIDSYGDRADRALVFLGVHGTRSINVQPILSGNLRLPTQLEGVHFSGAAFGHGIYFATDWKKSYGYTGQRNAYYGSGGSIQDRGFFLLLSDVIMGVPHMATSTGSWAKPPRGKDSIAVYPEKCTVINDEHVIFSPDQQRIRYLIEAKLS